MKHLLCLHIKPNRASQLFERTLGEAALDWVQECDRVLLARAVFIFKDLAVTCWANGARRCATCRQRRKYAAGWKVMVIKDRRLTSAFSTSTYVCVRVWQSMCEVRAKIFKAYTVMLCHWGRRWRTCSRANHHLPETSSPPLRYPCPSLTSRYNHFFPLPPKHLHFISCCFSPLSAAPSREGSEQVSLDVLNSSWHAVSQLHLLLWMITGACTPHCAATHRLFLWFNRDPNWWSETRSTPTTLPHSQTVCVCVKKSVQWRHLPTVSQPRFIQTVAFSDQQENDSLSGVNT